ncbi:MAG: hypothetical protein H7177_04985 [Rhizobacter sp.]|nr:hypothetical protein [Bacteriovorax sp.]
MKILIIIAALVSISAHAQEEKKNVIYKYKEYEVIDLGSLEIKGQIMAPGDLTVNERERQSFKRSLLEKNNFDFENRREIENLR